MSLFLRRSILELEHLHRRCLYETRPVSDGTAIAVNVEQENCPRYGTAHRIAVNSQKTTLVDKGSVQTCHVFIQSVVSFQ